MKCSKCNSKTKVIEKRERVDFINRRRRECTTCGGRFTTKEITEEKYLALLAASSAGRIDAQLSAKEIKTLLDRKRSELELPELPLISKDELPLILKDHAKYGYVQALENVLDRNTMD